MTNILNNCNNLINNFHNCSDFGQDPKETCFSCLRNSFYGSGTDTYNCLKKLCYYTINYGPAYVNEIYSFLKKSEILESFKKDNINIYSLGSGFSPDYIAMEKYIKKNEVNFKLFSYFGFDIEPLWRDITQDAIPILADLTRVPINYNNVDIIFLNKLFSTLKNHNSERNFLNRFAIDLKTLPTEAYIIFNDINHYNMGRDDFDRFMQSNNFKLIEKYYFNIENAYSDNYTELDTKLNVCSIPDNLCDTTNNFSFDSKIEPNKTIFFLYQKGS